MSTHLGNGVPNYIKRHPNLDMVQLAIKISCLLYCRPPPFVKKYISKVMLKAKGKSSILVSDSVKFAGLPEGRYNSSIGGDAEVSSDGRISMANTIGLAGSGSSLF